MIEKTRRALIRGGTLIIAGALAGCPDSPQRRRELAIRHIEVGNESDAGTELRITVENLGTGSKTEWATFTDVTVLGYSSSGDLVCEKHVGTVEPGTASFLQTLRCDTFPALLTFAADQSPCDDDTFIRVARYNSSAEEDYSWDIENYRECSEGLPPKIPTGISSGTNQTVSE